MDRDQAFEPVYYEYYPKIFRYIHKRLSSYHEAEDLTQEILIACYRNFDRYDPKKASLATWIYVIAHNRLRNY